MCLCVCLWRKYLEKYLTNQLNFWWETSLWPGGQIVRFWEKWDNGVCGESEIFDAKCKEGGGGDCQVPKWWEADIWLQLDTNRKSYWESNCNIRFDAECPCRSTWISMLLLSSYGKIYRERVKLQHQIWSWVTLKLKFKVTPISKSYILWRSRVKGHMGSTIAPSGLTLSEREWTIFNVALIWRLVHVVCAQCGKGVEQGHMLL